ncbi:hypothetical protein TeGR_g12726 [Tetraparma gracilis]|uniref:Uncharacterized protein n=1 Tax=Tetraparma gracilis TaxID=2962635 RepID=A0ABQ6MFT9_9STRA|nr:hypothetical protein TeGR_g12726 [Tetraparma gracilis]
MASFQGYNFNVHDLIASAPTDPNCWGELMSILDLFPGCAYIRHRSGDLPLHALLSVKAPEDVALAFAAKSNGDAPPPPDPEAPAPLVPAPPCVPDTSDPSVRVSALSLPSSSGAYPFHLALSNGYTDGTCLALSDPAALRAVNALGEPALFSAISLKRSAVIVRHILEGFPGAAEEMDEMDNLPLHECVRVGAEKEVLRMVYDAYPEAKDVENGDGDVVEVDL